MSPGNVVDIQQSILGSEMDNLSHTLIGALMGEALEHGARRGADGLPAATRRNLLLVTMTVGSNLPDIDLIYPEITNLKLDYLLHHRGHTHTVLGALVIAMLLFAACRAWLRYRRLTPSTNDVRWLAGAALLAPLLHIAMDFSNSYGVHPFWPVWNGWLYGDSIFIVEPLFWAAATPLMFTVRTMFARALIGLILIAGVVLSIVTDMVPTLFTAMLIVITIALLLVGRMKSQRVAIRTGLGTWLVVTAVFAICGRIASHKIEVAGRESDYGAVLDRVLTPMPVNPICWEAILVQATADQFALRRAIVSLAPALIAADACPYRAPSQGLSGPVQAATTPDDASIQWRGDVILSRAELANLAATHCEVSHLLRFARAPFFTTYEGTLLAGDLRFDREPEPSFAEIQIGRDRCSRIVPPWTPPRQDLLGDEPRALSDRDS